MGNSPKVGQKGFLTEKGLKTLKNEQKPLPKLYKICILYNYNTSKRIKGVGTEVIPSALCFDFYGRTRFRPMAKKTVNSIFLF